MGFNFPASPSDGTVFAPSGGPSYVFSNGVWKLSGGGTSFVVVADTPPVNPFPGQLWFESDTGALFFWYVDADSSQWVQVNFTPSGMNTAQARNRIVNGGMQVSQENGSVAGSTSAYYAADQWPGTTNAATGVVAFGRIASTAFNVPYRLRLLCTTAQASLAAGEYSHIYQPIEGVRISDFRWGTAYAVPAVLRFDAYADQAGTYSVSIRDGGAPPSASFVANFTLAAGVTRTITVPIPVPSIGTWPTDNTRGMYVAFCFAAGATLTTPTPNQWVSGSFIAASGISNGLSAVSNSLNVWNVGLHLDPLATGVPPAWTMPDEAAELAACMRYWQISGANNQMFSGNVTSGSTYLIGRMLQVQMRVPPSVSGTPGAATSFPNTTGTLSATTTGLSGFQETRVANASGPGNFSSLITANSRM
jgi:hypothetical protein